MSAAAFSGPVLALFQMAMSCFRVSAGVGSAVLAGLLPSTSKASRNGEIILDVLSIIVSDMAFGGYDSNGLGLEPIPARNGHYSNGATSNRKSFG